MAKARPYKWYKRDPEAALNGMMGLTLEEKGAYNTVLDLIYDKDDNLRDDDFFIAGWCGCDVRVWKRIKKSLIEKGKLHTSGGTLKNDRATSVVDLRKSASAEKVSAGRQGGIKSGASRKKNNNLAEASAQANSEANHEAKANRVESIEIRDKNTPLPPKGESEDFRLFEKALREIPGVNDHPIGADVVIAPIWQLALKGYDLHTQIIPSIKARLAKAAPKSIRSWRYFVDAIVRDASAPTSAPPPSTPTDLDPKDWPKRMDYARRHKTWDPRVWGPYPHMPGCIVPANLVLPEDGKDWTDYKATA